MLAFLLIVASGAFVVCLIVLPGGHMELKLVFVGYTNALLQAQDPAGRLTPFEVRASLLLATNTGSVPVQIWAGGSPADFNDTNFARPMGLGLPSVIRPGESIAVTAWPPYGQSRWRTKFFYQRHSLSDRLYGKAWNSGSRAIQRIMTRVLPSLKEGRVESGWITNTPPPRLSIRTNVIDSTVFHRIYHITAPPSALPADLFGDPHIEATKAKTE